MECDCCRQDAMRREIGTLLLSFFVSTRDNAGNIICHDISGVDNDDFVATRYCRQNGYLHLEMLWRVPWCFECLDSDHDA